MPLAYLHYLRWLVWYSVGFGISSEAFICINPSTILPPLKTSVSHWLGSLSITLTSLILTTSLRALMLLALMLLFALNSWLPFLQVTPHSATLTTPFFYSDYSLLWLLVFTSSASALMLLALMLLALMLLNLLLLTPQLPLLLCYVLALMLLTCCSATHFEATCSTTCSDATRYLLYYLLWCSVNPSDATCSAATYCFCLCCLLLTLLPCYILFYSQGGYSLLILLWLWGYLHCFCLCCSATPSATPSITQQYI